MPGQASTPQTPPLKPMSPPFVSYYAELIHSDFSPNRPAIFEMIFNKTKPCDKD